MFVSRKLLALAAPPLFLGLTGNVVLAQVIPRGNQPAAFFCEPPGNPGDYAVSVTPDDSAVFREPFTAGHTATFTVTNTGNCQDTYTFTPPTPSGPITSITLNKTSALLMKDASTTVTATYTVTGSGVGALSMWATGVEGGASEVGSFSISGPPSNWDASPLNQNHQALGRCGAGCFAATHAQSTVPYISLDAPRNVTLVYQGDRVWPKPFIHLNVQKPSGAVPDTLFLEVKKGGTFQTFSNGETRLKFAAAGSGWQRIAGQLRDSTWATAMHAIEIIVTWKYASGVSTVQTWPTKLLIVNETSSPIARGWTFGGVQRAYALPDSSIIITEGDGSAVFFQKSTTTTFTKPFGEFSTLVVNGSGWKRTYPDSTRVFFNSAGRVSDVYDRFNNRTQFFYDASNRLTTIRDPQGLDLVLAYGTYGLSSIRDNISLFRYTNLTVPSDSSLTAIQDPDGVSTTYQYDGNRRLWKITNRRGHTTTLGYQTINGKVTGKLASVTAPTVAIYGEGNVAPVVSYAPWQTVGVPYAATISNPSPVITPDTVYGRITDAGGHASKFTINRWGTPAVVIDAIGRMDSTRFDSNGLPIRLRSAAGAMDSAVYNVNGLPTFVKNSGQPATLFRYVGWAQADSVWRVDASSGARYFIGANGRVDSVRVAGNTSDQATTRLRYDSRGRVDSVADPLQHLVQRTWYAGLTGNRSRDSVPGGRETIYAYDAYGRDTSVSRPGLARTRTFYSVLNRPDSVRDGVNPVPIRYGYDNLFLTSVTDPKGQVYGVTYNALGWLTHRTDPLSRSDQYEYSRDGELRRWTNRRSQAITYTFDALHRRTGKSGTNTATESWSYPSDTVVVAISPPAADTLLTNRDGQLLRASTLMAGQHYVRRYTYTPAGALDSVIPAGAGIVFQARQYLWNMGRGTLTSIKLGATPAVTGLSYTPDGLPATKTLPGGEQITMAYTNTHASAEKTTTASYSGSVNRAAGLDVANRVERHVVAATYGHQFSYDSLGRLLADSTIMGETPCSWGPPFQENGSDCAWYPDWAVTSGVSFSYDSAGNRRDLSGTYGTGNRITWFNGCSYATDFDGNVTSRTCGSETAAFAWTADNRLDTLKVGGQITTFAYNALGRLVKKTTGTSIRHFLWERDNVLAELDGAGTSQIAEYSYYPGLDNLHALIVGGTKYFAHGDMLGNVVALTDSNQLLERYYEYDGWGNMTTSIDYAGFAGKDRTRFKGALWVGEQTELYYMRNRWYEPRAGRFLSEDPIGLQGGLNPYTYASNDPVNARDPSGLLTCDGILFVVDGIMYACDQQLVDLAGSWLMENFGISFDDAWSGTTGGCEFGSGGTVACGAGGSFQGLGGPGTSQSSSLIRVAVVAGRDRFVVTSGWQCREAGMGIWGGTYVHVGGKPVMAVGLIEYTRTFQMNNVDYYDATVAWLAPGYLPGASHMSGRGNCVNGTAEFDTRPPGAWSLSGA